MARVLKVLLKIILYLVDIVTDWMNGAEHINRVDFYSAEFDQQDGLEGSNASLGLPQCPAITNGHTFGSITIGLSWLPGIVAVIFYKSIQPEQPKHMMVIRFIMWPMYVPFQIFIAGIWPDSKLAKSFIFPQKNDHKMDNYSMGIYFKCMEGVYEAGPQLVIQIVSIMQGLAPSLYQMIALATSSLTLTMTNMELYFMSRDAKRSCFEILQRNILLTPFFLINSMFKILTISLIFTVFNLWGLLIVILWSVMYHHLVICVHRNFTYLGIAANLFLLGPLNTIIIAPGGIPSHKWEFLQLNLTKGPPIRYKSLIRMSVWMHFCYFSIWLLYAPILQLITNGSAYTGHFREFGITLHCILDGNLCRLTLITWIGGLLSCMIVEFYLLKFPQILGLNKENDYCTPIQDVSQKEMENIDIANETCNITDTFLELSQNIRGV